MKRQERIAAKRESVEKACERIDMDFAMDLFAEVIFERKTLTAEDFKAVFYQFARSAEHRPSTTGASAAACAPFSRRCGQRFMCSASTTATACAAR